MKTLFQKCKLLATPTAFNEVKEAEHLLDAILKDAGLTLEKAQGKPGFHLFKHNNNNINMGVDARIALGRAIRKRLI